MRILSLYLVSSQGSSLITVLNTDSGFRPAGTLGPMIEVYDYEADSDLDDFEEPQTEEDVGDLCNESLESDNISMRRSSPHSSNSHLCRLAR